MGHRSKTLPLLTQIALGLLSACGAARPTTAMPPGADSDVRAHAATSLGVCGGFETLGFGKELPLLGGRLMITPLEGSAASARPHDIMAAPAPSTSETRLMLERGNEKLVVFSEEVFARPGPDLVSALKHTDPRIAELPMRECTLSSGVRAVIVTHPKLDGSSDAIAVAHAYTVLADDTLQVTHVFVSREVVHAGSDGCTALAVRILETLKAGSRHLDLGGGDRQLDPGYALVVPPEFAVVSQPGPDFAVYRVFPVRPISTPTGQLGIYFGGHPSFAADPKADQHPGKLLGENVTWYVTRSKTVERREALVKRGANLLIHVFIDAPSAHDADELERVAETLKSSR